jgi:hypothetical protein
MNDIFEGLADLLNPTAFLVVLVFVLGVALGAWIW